MEVHRRLDILRSLCLENGVKIKWKELKSAPNLAGQIKETSMTNISYKYRPDSIYDKLLPYCEKNEDKEYIQFHKIRFSYILEQVESLLIPGARVASIGLSIFDILMQEIALQHSVEYNLLVPSNKFMKSFGRSYDTLNIRLCDVTSTISNWDNFKYDIVLFYEVLEHLPASDELIISNLSKLLRKKGILLGSVPNVSRATNRFAGLTGRNIYWKKSMIIDGVYGGFGHLREYTFLEMTELLSHDFVIRSMGGLNPYNYQMKYVRTILNVLPMRWRDIILFEAEKK